MSTLYVIYLIVKIIAVSNYPIILKINQNSDGINTITNEFNLAFIHIPKNAGTMIEGLLKFQYNISVGFSVDYRQLLNKQLTKLPCPQWHVPLNWIFKYAYDNNMNNLSLISPYYSKFDNLKQDSFAIIRHPYERFVSEYKYCSSDNYECVMYLFGFFTHHCSKYIAQNCTEIPKYIDYCNVDNFNMYANVLLKYLNYEGHKGYKNRGIMGCHYIPQSEYIFHYQTKQKMIGHILRFENLSNDIIKLLKKYKNTRDINESIIQQYHKSHGQFRKYCQDLTFNDLSIENRKLLQAFYIDDFENFNYFP
eukprot:233508_1